MRWDNLFDDLESQLEQELSAEEVDLQAEEERLRVARLGIRDRLYALHRHVAGGRADGSRRVFQLVLRDGTRIAVLPSTFGKDWFSGEIVEETGRRPACVIPLDAIDGILLGRGQVSASIDSTLPEEPPSALSARLGIPFVLRDLARRRVAVGLDTMGGPLHGTIDRVGRDHLDLAVHEAGRPRRESEVSEYRIVRLSQVLVVRL